MRLHGEAILLKRFVNCLWTCSDNLDGPAFHEGVNVVEPEPGFSRIECLGFENIEASASDLLSREGQARQKLLANRCHAITPIPSRKPIGPVMCGDIIKEFFGTWADGPVFDVADGAAT